MGSLDLDGRRILVTGGSRGIGAACCRLFARCGAAVLAQYLASGEKATNLLAELRALSDRPHTIYRCDVTQAAQVKRLFEFVADRWGGLDCLVNNAGVWVYDPLATLDPERLAATFSVNIVGPFLCAREAAPLLQAAADGSIVNVSSTAGQRGEPFYSAYAASKGALISATKSWACELAPKIRVNAVAPGWVDTDMTAGALATSREAALASIPLARIATPTDIAGPVAFLASPLARHITGEILNVNGGSVLVG